MSVLAESAVSVGDLLESTAPVWIALVVLGFGYLAYRITRDAMRQRDQKD